MLPLTDVRKKRKPFIAVQSARVNIFNHVATRLYFNSGIRRTK